VKRKKLNGRTVITTETHQFTTRLIQSMAGIFCFGGIWNSRFFDSVMED
jgi:hypothetical protein